MKNEKKQKQLEKLIREGKRDERESLIWFQSGRTVKSVDFQRIENNPYGTEPLTPFELEVKEKLAGAPSPYDELARIEEEEEREQKEHSLRTKLGLLVLRANFSPQEKKCYELHYEKKYSPRDVQSKMRISQFHFCCLRKQIEKKLVSAHQRVEQLPEATKKMGASQMTKRQKEIMKLKNEGMTLKKISEKYGVSIPRIHQILREGVKNIL